MTEQLREPQWEKITGDDWVDSSRRGMRALVSQGRMTQREYEETCAWQDREKQQGHEQGGWLVRAGRQHEQGAER